MGFFDSLFGKSSKSPDDELKRIVDMFIIAALEHETYQGVNFLQDTRVYCYKAVNILQQKRYRAVSEMEYVESVKPNILFFMNRSFYIMKTIQDWLKGNLPSLQEALHYYETVIDPQCRKMTSSGFLAGGFDTANACVISAVEWETIDILTFREKCKRVESLYAQLRLADSALIDIHDFLPQNVALVSRMKEYNPSDVKDLFIEKLRFITNDCSRTYPTLFNS